MLTINFNPFPILESKNLKYRRVTSDDIPAIKILRGNPETMRFIPRPLVLTDEDAQELIDKFDDNIDADNGINWGITTKENNNIIGLVSFHRIYKENFRAEIGYMINPDYANKGYTTEAVDCLLDFGFEILHFNSVEAIISPENYASEKVLLKNGFVKEAHFKENGFYNGEFLDSYVYSLLKRNRIKNKNLL